jgi:hypothetical protein
LPNKKDGTHENGRTDYAKERHLKSVDARSIHEQLDDDTVGAEDDGGCGGCEITDERSGFNYSH